MDFSLLSWKKSELGFVVCVVAAILGISLFQLRISQMKTRDAQRKADVELVARAIDAYYSDYKEYPTASKNGEIIACGREGLEVCVWGEGKVVDRDEVVYLSKLPVEPQAEKGLRYVYEVDESRQKYKIYIALEYKSDPAYNDNLTAMCGEKIQCRWYVGN